MAWIDNLRWEQCYQSGQSEMIVLLTYAVKITIVIANTIVKLTDFRMVLQFYPYALELAQSGRYESSADSLEVHSGQTRESDREGPCIAHPHLPRRLDQDTVNKHSNLGEKEPHLQ